MGKKKSKQQQQPKICTNCVQYQTSDKPNKLANLGFRVIYTLVAWWWLGYGLSEGSSFFVSLGLFIIPLAIEYISFKPEEPWRNKLKNVQLVFCAIGITIATLGVFGGIEIINDVDTLVVVTTSKHLLMKDWNLYIPLKILYKVTVVFIASTTIDWIASPRNIEIEYKRLSCEA